MSESFLNGKVTLLRGDCLDQLPTLPENSVDSVVCDPPYHLTSVVKRFGADNAAPCKVGKTGAYARASKGFMGKQWDGGDIAFNPLVWELVFRVLKPGGHLLAFSGTRTYHRMACAIEDAGFEIRDQIGWCYGSGFPKSHDVSKGIDKALGAERGKVRVDASAVRNPKATGAGRDGMEGATRPWIEAALERGYHEAVSDEAVSDEAVSWQGWGTALKPAWEPMVLARKPLSEKSVAANVLKHGTGAINVDGCRVGTADNQDNRRENKGGGMGYHGANGVDGMGRNEQGRWPANLIHDGSEEVLEAFPDAPGQQLEVNETFAPKIDTPVYGDYGPRPTVLPRGDGGSAARFFYTAKADADDRLGSKHPTVKPLDLMQYLVRLVTPKGGTVLDPFAGTGTTGEAAFREGCSAVLIEREDEYQADISKRMGLVLSGPDERRAATVQQLPPDDLPMFSTLNTEKPDAA